MDLSIFSILGASDDVVAAVGGERLLLRDHLGDERRVV